VQIPVQIQN